METNYIYDEVMEMFGDKTFFIDADKLRVGSFLDSWIDGDTLYVKFLPLNSFGVFGGAEIIAVPNITRNIVNNVLITVDRLSNVKGTFQQYKILTMGENENAMFLDMLNIKIAELQREIERQRRERARELAMLRRGQLITRAGGEMVLHDFKRKKEALGEKTEPEEKKRRGEFYGGEY